MRLSATWHDAVPYRAPAWLRSGHLQTLLASGLPRRMHVRHAARGLREHSEPVVLDSGNGARLGACHTPAGTAACGLAVVLHGWEGSAESSYVLESAIALHAAGWDVLRLNFRDHGGTHALNRGLFHSCLLDEVVGAIGAAAKRFSAPRLVVAGFSLGGNFALRVARQAPDAGLPVERVVAICPVVDPHRALSALEASPYLYERYFLRKWRASLRRKQQLFPEPGLFESAEMRFGLRELTRVLVERHTDFGTLDRYLDGYSIAGSRLAGLQVPAAVLAARDDPVIPVADFTDLADHSMIRLDLSDHGGHCGFLTATGLGSYCSGYLVRQLAPVRETHGAAAA